MSSTRARLGLLLLLVPLACLALFVFTGRQRSLPTPAPTESNITIVVTIDGRDTSTGDVIDPINLWDNWPTRSRVTGTTHDGEQGALLKKNGGGCLIRMQSGAQGWVTCSNFIKEFKK